MIQTRMRKSGSKRVYKQEDEGIRGGLNEAARDVFRGGEKRGLTPGVAGLSDPLIRQQSTNPEVVLQQRHRKSLGSLKRHKATRGTKI